MLTGREPTDVLTSVCPLHLRGRSHSLTADVPDAGPDLQTERQPGERTGRQTGKRHRQGTDGQVWVSVPLQIRCASTLISSISSRRKLQSAELPSDAASCWKQEVTRQRDSWARSHSPCCRRRAASSSTERRQRLMMSSLLLGRRNRSMSLLLLEDSCVEHCDQWMLTDLRPSLQPRFKFPRVQRKTNWSDLDWLNMADFTSANKHGRLPQRCHNWTDFFLCFQRLCLLGINKGSFCVLKLHLFKTG